MESKGGGIAPEGVGGDGGCGEVESNGGGIAPEGVGDGGGGEVESKGGGIVPEGVGGEGVNIPYGLGEFPGVGGAVFEGGELICGLGGGTAPESRGGEVYIPFSGLVDSTCSCLNFLCSPRPGFIPALSHRPKGLEASN